MNDWVMLNGMFIQAREDGGLDVIRPDADGAAWDRERFWPPASGLVPEFIGSAGTLAGAARL